MSYKRLREIERITKGVANHRRLQILDLLARQPELSVIEVANELEVNFKTISEHIRRLALAGLVMKRNEYTAVRHRLTSRGVVILKFLRTLE